jgi:hypothetical protein
MGAPGFAQKKMAKTNPITFSTQVPSPALHELRRLTVAPGAVDH